MSISGGPQDQIQAFRAVRISPEFRERFDCPEITPQSAPSCSGAMPGSCIRCRRRVLDKYLPRDAVSVLREAYRNAPDPRFATYGPKTRREFLNLKRWNGERGVG